MVGWIILGVVLLIILVLVISWATVIIDYDGDFFVKVKYFGITVYQEPEKEKSPKKSAENSEKESKNEAEPEAETVEADKTVANSERSKKPRTFLGIILTPFRLLLKGLWRLLKGIFRRIVDSYKSLYAPNKEKLDDPNKETSDADTTKKDKKKNKKKDRKKADAPSKGSMEAPTFDELMELLRMVLDSLGRPLKKILKRIAFSHLSFDALCGGDDAARAAINYGSMNIALGSVLNLVDQFFTLKTPDDLNIDVDFYQEKTEVKVYVEIRLTVGAVLAFVFALLGRLIKNYFSRKLARRAIKKLTAKPKAAKAEKKAG